MDKLLRGVLDCNTFDGAVVPTKAFAELSQGVIVSTFLSTLCPGETKSVISAQRCGTRKKAITALEKAFKHIKLSKTDKDQWIRFLGIKINVVDPRSLICVVCAHNGEAPSMTYSTVYMDGHLWVNPGAAAGSVVEVVDVP